MSGKGQLIKEDRRYERHHLSIPIVVQLEEVANDKTEYLSDISIGGLSFKSNKAIKKGSPIDIRIPLVRPVFEAQGEVAWCRKRKDYYMVGVKFIKITDAFRLRMVEQICHIEKYKKEVCELKGKTVTGEEAALEWIKKYAKHFPRYKQGK